MTDKQNKFTNAVKRYNRRLTKPAVRQSIKPPQTPVLRKVQVPRTNIKRKPLIPKRDFWDWLMDYYIIIGIVVTVVIFVILCAKGKL